jgi:hypothetical protein
MSRLNYRSKPDRRAGLVLIAIFTIGMLGASVAAALNGGKPPQSAAAHALAINVTAPI